ARTREPWETVSLGELRDCERLNEFVRCAYARLLSVASHLLGNVDDGGDVVQTAFLELHQVVAERLAEPRALALAFMYERVRWRAYDRIRERRRQPIAAMAASSPSGADEPAPGGDSGWSAGADEMPDMEVLVTALEKARELRQLGMQLPGRNRA